MPAMGGHGQSFEATIDKQRCLGSALAIGTKIASKFSNSRFSYWHFDANAGCGHNRTCDVPGSPIVFHTIADACLNGMQRRAFFCDRDQATLNELSIRTTPWKSSSLLFAKDNEEVLEVFAQCIRDAENPIHAVGSVICDPNGYWYRNAKTGEGPPITGLTNFTSAFPKIDIVLNLNARFYRLTKQWPKRPLPPRDVLASLNKSHWLVRHTQFGNSNDWLLAVGRNVSTGDHQKLGFHKLDSIEGHAIMLKVEGGQQDDLLDRGV